MNYAPIVIFAYNRPHHTRKLLQSLKQNNEVTGSDIYVFIDGLKPSANEEDKKKRNEVIELVNEITWCRNAEVSISDKNKGLAASVMEGVNTVLEKHDRVIVLEDDLVCDRYFLSFMNQALDLYRDEERIACVSGYIYPLKDPPAGNFFIKGADCWGWATWKRAWKIFEPDAGKLLEQIKSMTMESEFNFNDTYPYLQMLLDKKEGRNSSWAILWYASAFVKDMLCLYPSHSLIQNTGNDASGTHSAETDIFTVELKNVPIYLEKSPPIASHEAFRQMAGFFAEHFPKENDSGGLARTLYRKIVPQGLRKWIYDLRQDTGTSEGWSGDYASWQQAAKDCGGYDQNEIFEKVKAAALQVKTGKAVFERDSVLFFDEEYNEAFLSVLELVAAENEGNLRVLDFGGSLGSVYFQYRKRLNSFKSVRWCIIEQKHFVDFGKEQLESEELKFYYSIEECMKNEPIDVVLLSSVLSYLEDPWALLEKLMKTKIKFLVIDRNLFSAGERDVITKQVVPPSIYNASYPCRIFSKNKMVKFISGAYDLVKEFDPYNGLKIKAGNMDAVFGALVFRRK